MSKRWVLENLGKKKKKKKGRRGLGLVQERQERRGGKPRERKRKVEEKVDYLTRAHSLGHNTTYPCQLRLQIICI